MNNFTLLGIDGGATKVSVWETKYNPQNGSFEIGNLNSEKKYDAVPRFLPSFKPVDINEQLKARGEAFSSTTEDEQQMETVYVEASAQAIKDVFNQTDKKPLLLGIGMPGLKTADMRGIEVVANGPRMMHYCQLLENRLKAMARLIFLKLFQTFIDMFLKESTLTLSYIHMLSYASLTDDLLKR